MSRVFLGKRSHSVVVAALIALSWTQPGRSAESPVLSASDLTSILTSADVGSTATNVTVAVTGSVVTVLAQKEASASDRDLKIDAMFLAKALVQAAPKQIEQVKVLFSQAGKDGRFVIITAREIADFGSGKISPEILLTNLKLISVTTQKAPSVVAGPEFERRLLVWQRIEKLRKEGTGVKPFENIFAEIESAAKENKIEMVSERTTFLETKLTEQEEHVKQARKTARGHGVPGLPQARAGGSPAPAGGAAGSGAGQTEYVPPQAEQIKSAFQQRADELIRLAQAKDSSSSQKLRSLKQQIDQCFSSSKRGEAFALIHQFQMLAQQTTGIDMLAPPGGPPGGEQGGPGGPGGPQGGTQGGPGGPPGGPGGPPGGPGGPQ